MWISRSRWLELNNRVHDCEKRIEKMEEESNEKLVNMAKKILGQPCELSKELNDLDMLDKFVDDFIHSR